jgi:hypothetical protein
MGKQHVARFLHIKIYLPLTPDCNKPLFSLHGPAHKIRDVTPKEIEGGGIVIPQGANIRFNDLAPGGRVPMVHTHSHLDHFEQFLNFT